MEFSVNSPILFVLAGIVIAVVLAQSIYFLVMAIRRAKAIGMDMTKIKKTISGSAIFTIVPAIAIVISIIALSKDLGLPLPWLRLSVIGSLSYETVAAANAENAMGVVIGSGNINAQQYITIVSVMTISIMVGIWLAPVLSKKLLGGMSNIEKRDKKWGDLLQNALFIGMISAFLGFVFSDFASVFTGNTAGLVPIFVFLVSALVMLLAAVLLKLTKIRAISDYALPISMILGMAAAIPLTAWLG